MDPLDLHKVARRIVVHKPRPQAVERLTAGEEAAAVGGLFARDSGGDWGCLLEDLSLDVSQGGAEEERRFGEARMRDDGSRIRDDGSRSRSSVVDRWG